MTIFAKLDENNIVEEIQAVSDDVAPTEEAGVAFLKQLLGADTNWKQSMKDGRKNPANKGFTYDASKDAFIAPKPPNHDSWTLNADTCEWEAPKAMPDDGKRYVWDESSKDYVEID